MQQLHPHQPWVHQMRQLQMLQLLLQQLWLWQQQAQQQKSQNNSSQHTSSCMSSAVTTPTAATPGMSEARATAKQSRGEQTQSQWLQQEQLRQQNSNPFRGKHGGIVGGCGVGDSKDAACRRRSPQGILVGGERCLLRVGIPTKEHQLTQLQQRAGKLVESKQPAEQTQAGGWNWRGVRGWTLGIKGWRLGARERRLDAKGLGSEAERLEIGDWRLEEVGAWRSKDLGGQRLEGGGQRPEARRSEVGGRLEVRGLRLGVMGWILEVGG